jgi:hypothetical protein
MRLSPLNALLIVILSRDDKFKGKGIRFNMDINGQRLQLLAGNTVRVPLPVGTHTLSVWSPSLEGQDSITIDVQEGWIYHVEGYIRWGYPAGRAKFKSVSETPAAPGSVASAANIEQPLAGAALGAAIAQPGSALLLTLCCWFSANRVNFAAPTPRNGPWTLRKCIDLVAAWGSQCRAEPRTGVNGVRLTTNSASVDQRTLELKE